jgi:hypothetical protein
MTPDEERSELGELKKPDLESASSSRLRRAALPVVSGKTSAIVLIICLILSAVIILPLSRRWPPWVEWELVFLAWWLIWIAVLTYLLHRGQRVIDDHTWTAPRSWLPSWGKSNSSSGGSGGDLSGCFPDVFDLGSLADVGAGGEACLIGCLVLIAIPLLLVAAWFVIEVAIPGLAFAAYLLLRGMLARVANDRHGCQGNWLRAALWASVWATAYTIPQAVLVWVLHVIAMRSQAG